MEVLLKGNYKSSIKLGIFKAKKKTNNVLLMIHGLYSVTGDSHSKSKVLGKTVLEKEIANVVYFSSSRDWDVFPADGDFEKQIESFKGKTFQQELDDLDDAIDYIIKQSKSLFGVEKGKLRFYVVANSIGGTLISILKNRFQYIDKLVLVGSGTGYGGSSKPILSTCPPEINVLNSTKTYKGELLFLQGSLDDVVPFEAQDNLFSSYKNARKRKITVEGANHSFSKMNGENKELAQKIYTDLIIKFLLK